MLPLHLIAAGVGGGPIVTLTNASSTDTPPSGNSWASFFFNSDGQIDKSSSVAGLQTGVNSLTNWIVPNQDGTPYQIRYLSGHGGDPIDNNASAEDAWVDLGTSREYEINRVITGTSTGAYTFEIRIGTGATLATAVFTISATKV